MDHLFEDEEVPTLQFVSNGKFGPSLIEDRPAIDIGDSELPATPCVRVHDYHHCECCLKSLGMGRHPNLGATTTLQKCLGVAHVQIALHAMAFVCHFSLGAQEPA
jgi:hypothetical protein